MSCHSDVEPKYERFRKKSLFNITDVNNNSINFCSCNEYLELKGGSTQLLKQTLLCHL